MERKKPSVVVVTGFGPFSIHSENPSWEAVKLLQRTNLEAEYDITLVTKEIPVMYDEVDQIVPNLWREYEPLLMVHVGVSRFASRVTLELCANRSGYDKLDVKDCELLNGCNLLGDEEQLKTGIDLEEIKTVAESNSINLTVSGDAGRYNVNIAAEIMSNENETRDPDAGFTFLSATHIADKNPIF